MEDDDWLMGEDEVNEADIQKQLAAKEIHNEQQKLGNQGYLDGLEWAEANYKSYDL